MLATPSEAPLAAGRETEFRQGWRAVLACFCVAIFAWGFGFYGQSVYLAELHRLHGWPTSVISAATTVFYLTGALLVPFVQRTLERVGARGLLAGGVLVIGAGAVWFASAAAEWQLFCAGLVMAIGWAGTSTTAIATTLALWFDRRRGFAISLALNGASASGFTVAPVLVLLSQTIGLRFAVLDAVLVGWAILFPLIFWCARRDPAVAATTHRSGARLGQSAALRDAHFWSVALPFALAIAAQVGFIVHMVAFLLPLLGRDGTSLAVTCSSVSAMIGRLTLGGAIDRLPRRATSAVCFLSQALGLGLLLTWPGSEAAVYTGIVLFGLSVGNVITLPTVIVQVEFPAASFGTIIGLSGAVGQFALAFAPGLFGILHDATGGYATVLVICMALQTSGAIILLWRRS